MTKLCFECIDYTQKRLSRAMPGKNAIYKKNHVLTDKVSKFNRRLTMAEILLKAIDMKNEHEFRE